ncbi:50S ribosomal protein L3 [Candidatus Kaiserbacteria bacterium]|nr:50S ribosomal protein L3 [Candidatus Kaiserbacteria bacterium]
MKFTIGTKKGMTQIFDADGRVHAVTIVSAPTVTVTQVKTPEKDGYTSVQVGYGVQKESRIKKPQRTKGLFRGLKEFRYEEAAKLEVGATMDASVFAEGDHVAVSAISKGKGFQGVVKRYGFKGGPRSHGQKHSERERGSSGGGPGRAGGRVVKGMRMAGRMGGDRITVSNLKVVRVEGDELYIEGAVPGRAGTVVEIRGK